MTERSGSHTFLPSLHGLLSGLSGHLAIIPGPVRGYLLLLVTLTVWGSFTLLSRVAIHSRLNPWDLTAIRFLGAAIILLPWLYFYSDRKKLLDARFLLLSFFGGFGYAAIAYMGFSMAPAAHAAIWLNGMLPFFSALAGWLLCGEHFTRHTWLGLLFIFAGLGGMALLLLRAGALAANPGDLFFLLAALCWASYTALLKRWGFAPVTAMLGVGIFSVALYMPVYILFLPHQLAHASWTSIVWQGVFHGWLVVIVAMLAYIGAVRYLGAFRTGSLLALAPLLAALLAVPLLHEPLNAGLLAGLAGVVTGAVQPWRWFEQDGWISRLFRLNRAARYVRPD